MSDKIIENMKSGKYERKELENLYFNAIRLGRNDIEVAAKEALKEKDIKYYSKRFVNPIKDKVLQIITEIAETENWANWDNNKISNGIKTGGAVNKTGELVEFHFAYRRAPAKKTSCFSVFQRDEESAVQYKVKPHASEDEKIFSSSKEAIELFREDIKD